MTYPHCAVCRRELDPGDDHTRVDVTHVNTTDRNRIDDHYLHNWCARAVFEGWGEP